MKHDDPNVEYAMSVVPNPIYWEAFKDDGTPLWHVCDGERLKQPDTYNPRHVPMIPLEGVPCIDYDTGKAWGFDLVFIHQTNGCWPIAASWYSDEQMQREIDALIKR